MQKNEFDVKSFYFSHCPHDYPFFRFKKKTKGTCEHILIFEDSNNVEI